MPELPEVEQFRQLLLPLVSTEHPLMIESVGENNRITLTEEDLSAKYTCTDVLRKGKQLCLVLQRADDLITKYLYLHMGMTGRIRVDGVSENWGGKKLNGEEVVSEKQAPKGADSSFPPKYTHVMFKCNGFTACFCDPRKFGSCYFANDLSALDELAPDAIDCKDDDAVVPKLSNQRLGIKAVLLDQKRAVSGVGNWVADEVLYQCHIHPDQSYLTEEQAATVWKTLQNVVSLAVNCLKNHTHYPESWLFHHRWTKKKAGKDAAGYNITFLTSGGRTSAIVAVHQKLYKSQGPARMNGKKSATVKKTVKAKKVTTTGKRKTREDLQKFKHVETKANTGRMRNGVKKEVTEAKLIVNARRRSPRFITP